MKYKLPVITACKQCQFFVDGYKRQSPYDDNKCLLAKKKFDWGIDMPDWCPLPDTTITINGVKI